LRRVTNATLEPDSGRKGVGGMNRTTLARRYAPLAIALAVQLLIIVTAPSTGPKEVRATGTASAAAAEAGATGTEGGAAAEPGAATGAAATEAGAGGAATSGAGAGASAGASGGRSAAAAAAPPGV